MKTDFLLEELILESRLDAVKKKYPKIDPSTIDYFSGLDPSGNNKYLEWMVKHYYSGITSSNIIKYVKLFHKNVNKLTKEFFDELIKEKKWEWVLTGNSPIEKSFQKIYKSPKDINNYEDFDLTYQILSTVDGKLSKSEVKKLEADVLYNSDNLLIMIPKSHKASCYYGAGTRWCTTNKESDHYFKDYTNKGTLIYVINKKEPEKNPWYKTAFLIHKGNGKVEVYDAPDHPTDVKVAAQNLGSNWEIIRDVIVEYLYNNDLSGVENFYFGQDLIAWLDSKNVDPIKILKDKNLIKRIGVEALVNYLKKRNINIYEHLSFDYLLELISPKEFTADVIAGIWNNYKSVGINPLIRMFLKHSDADLVIRTIKDGGISLDEFLHFSNDPNFLTVSQYAEMGAGKIFPDTVNIFVIINTFYGSNRPDDWWGSRSGNVLLDLFNNDVELIFGYAKNIGVNLFDALDVRSMNLLLSKKFDDTEDKLKFILKNKEHLKSTLVNYGIPKKTIIEYAIKQPNSLEFFKDLVDRKLIKTLSLEETLPFFSNKKEAFLFWLKNERPDFFRPRSYEGKHDIDEILEDMGPEIKKIFPDIESFETFMKGFYPKGLDLMGEVSAKSLWFSFFNKDFYKLYKTFIEKDRFEDLSTLMLIKAYEDAPVDEDTGLKNIVFQKIREELKGNYKSKLETREGVDYVLFENLTRVLGLIADGRGDVYDTYLGILENKTNEGDIKVPTFDFSDIYNFIDNDFIIKIIKDFLIEKFREKKVTLNLDWLEEFDELGDRIKIDDVNGDFSFKLYDEIIDTLSNYKILILIEHSPEFKKLKKLIASAYKSVSRKEIMTDVKNELMNRIAEIFGNDFFRIKNKKNSENIYEFRYDYLLDDAIAFANEYVFHEDNLPNSVFDLISELQDNSYGRKIVKYSTEDLEDFIYSWYPDPQDQKFLENFAEFIYKTLDKIED